MNDGPLQSSDDDVRQRLEAGLYHDAFERLLVMYRQKVFHLAYSMIRNETQAEDVTQDIFLRIWRGLPGYNGAASLSTWIYTISRNTCLTELKKRAARPTVSLHDPELETRLDSLPALQSADREKGVQMDVDLLLAQLPDKYRRVITLFYLENKSYEECSALLGLPMGTVKTFLFRARKELLRRNRQATPLPACA